MSDSLEVSVRVESGIGIVGTDGYINNTGAEEVADACNALIEEGTKRLVFNLSKSRIINSIGVSVLIEIIEKVKALEGGVAFCCLTPTIAKTFRIMGLLNASTVHETEEEAIGQVSGQEA